MEISKLFGALVVGGSLLAGCSGEDDPVPADAREPLTSESPDAARAEADGGEDAGELIDCGFCPNDMCCETDGDGNTSVKAGFECCWGTAC